MTTMYKVRLREGVAGGKYPFVGNIRPHQERLISKEAHDALFATTASSERYLAKLFKACGTMELPDEPVKPSKAPEKKAKSRNKAKKRRK